MEVEVRVFEDLSLSSVIRNEKEETVSELKGLV